MVAVPGATAVTNPPALTVAAAGLSDAQATVRSVRTFPPPSLSVAANRVVPRTTSAALAGVMLTDATGTSEDSVVVPPATLDSSPNTAFWFSVPRNATNSNWSPAAESGPSTVRVPLAPIALPVTGVLHVPFATLVALPQS